jgi:hypothetical protein
MNIAHFNHAVSYGDIGVNCQHPPITQLTEFADVCYHNLIRCPRIVNYLLTQRNIDGQLIHEKHIGYFDIALPLLNDSDLLFVDYRSFEELRGCITVPILRDEETVGIQGELYKSIDQQTPHNHLLSPNVVIEPFRFSKSVLRCVSQLDVFALQKHGYQNSFCDLSGSVSELTFDRLHRMGVEVLVYFTDAYGADFDIKRAEELSHYYRIQLCEVKLPFALTNFGLWDMYQWQLLDKRLSSCLKLFGAYNERYQA